MPETTIPPTGSTERAEVVATTPESLTIDVEAAAPGLLVVSQIYAEGWRATVDGEPVSILATNHSLQGIPIDAGRHVVELQYRPASLRIGLWISAIALASMGSTLAWRGAVRLGRRQGVT